MEDYILITESDLMVDAMRRQLMAEFDSQKKAQANSFVTELATNMRNFNDEWEKRLESATKEWSDARSQLLSKLEVAHAAQERLETRIQQLEAVIQDWADQEGEQWWSGEETEHDKEGHGESRSGNRMSDPTPSGPTYHELDREDGYSHVGSEAAGDVTVVAHAVASKAAMNASLQDGR
jgi:polyhydroxyalkanoate synthesis regulator phasin